MTILPLTSGPKAAPPALRVSDLRQWVYCPRVVWWTHVSPVGKVESYKMRQGLLKERRLQRLQRRRTLRAFGLDQGTVECNVPLRSPAWGLTGKLDMLVHWRGQHYPVEIKFTHGPARLNHRIQLAGYALLIEEAYQVQVPFGYIVRLPDDTVERVPLDEPLRELAKRTLAAMRQVIQTEQIPPASPIEARCIDCEYRHFCGDVPVYLPTLS